MFKSLLYACILGILLGGVESNITCFIEKIDERYSVHNLVTIGTYCNHVHDLFEEMRQSLKSCAQNDVTVDGVESLVTDLCNPDSQLLHDIANAECSVEVTPIASICLPRGSLTLSSMERWRRTCRIRVGVYKCLTDYIAKSCGGRALRAVTRILEAAESYYEGVCAEVEALKETTFVTEATDVVSVTSDRSQYLKGTGAEVTSDRSQLSKAGADVGSTSRNSMYLWHALLGVLFVIII